MGWVVGVEGVDEAWGEVGVVGGFGFDEVAVGAGFFDEGAVHPLEAFGGARHSKLWLRPAAEACQHHFGGFLGGVGGGGVDFVGEDEAEVLAADAVEGFGGAAEEGDRARGEVEGVFGLGGDAEVEGDVEAFQEVVEGAHPDVADHDVGGLEDGGDRSRVGEAEEDGFGGEGVGFAAAEAGAVAEDFVVGVVDELSLGWEKGVVDAGAQGFGGFVAAGAFTGGAFQALASRDSG